MTNPGSRINSRGRLQAAANVRRELSLPVSSLQKINIAADGADFPGINHKRYLLKSAFSLSLTRL